MTSSIQLSASAVPEAVVAEDPLFQKRPDEFLAIPTSFNRVVQGVPLSVPAQVFLSLKKIEGSIRVNARAVGDLSDLQRKIGALIDTIPLPTDNCARFSADNIVASIGGKQITISGDVATLKLSGHVEVWGCVDLHIFGHGKTRFFGQGFDSDLPLRVVIVDSQTLAVQLGDPDIRFDGFLGIVPEEVLKFLGLDVNARAKQALADAIHPELLKGALPEELLNLDPVITQAGLFSNSGAPAVSMEMNVPFTTRTLVVLLETFNKLRG